MPRLTLAFCAIGAVLASAISLAAAPLVGGTPPKTAPQAQAAGGCTFHIECDDAQPCTLDYCDITPGQAVGTGVCVNQPLGDGQPGDCDDGYFCNGVETCQNLECMPGVPATCCMANDLEEYCTEELGYCARSFDRCSTDAECGAQDVCRHCVPICSVNADCNDGLACNGTETCVGGNCQAGVEICGWGAFCAEKQCIGQTPATACETADDCNSGVSCNNSAGALCRRGRCCKGPASSPLCSDLYLSQGPPLQNCLSQAGHWFAGDDGYTTGVANTCGGKNPFQPGTELGCPRYSSGIAQTTALPPAHPVIAGPVSKSPQAVPAPVGPTAPLNRLGDDYQVSDGSHLSLAAFRFVGTMSLAGALVFEFWDAAGNPVGSVTASIAEGTGVRIVYVYPPLIIPPQGHITATVSGTTPNVKFHWHSAASITVGSNDTSELFVNESHDAANFMAPSPAILSFELLGPPVAAPLGACCVSGGCSELTRWVCEGQNGQFQGVGSNCPTSACDLGACCDPVTGDCDTIAQIDCTGEFQGLGTDCSPDCCPQPSVDEECSDGACFTGADQCANAVVHSIPALAPGDPPHVVTITGDNSFATSTEAQPDSCFGPAESVGDNAGWFEAFHLAGTCTLIRIDACCSELTRPSLHPWLARSCSCEDRIVPAANPYDTIAAVWHGPPYCDDENAWSTFGLLGPGDYYIPLPSSQLDPRGPYQMHITAEACPTAACCLPDGTCAGPMHQLACDALGGTWLGPPQRASIIADCNASPCATGSCCTGPATCEDVSDGDFMDKAACDGLGGTYIGGIRCEGGYCVDEPLHSCGSSIDCPSGGNCAPGPLTPENQQPNPCPLCPIEADGQCNLFDSPLYAEGATSDLGFGPGYLAADDFIATSTDPIDSVCIWGYYLFKDPDPNWFDCSDQTLGDNFRVRILATGPYGLPDAANVIGVSSATSTKANTYGITIPPHSRFAFHLTLTSPISGLTGGQKYWLEVANDLQPDDECYWVWSRLSSWSPAGNDFSAVGNELVGYFADSAQAEDQAFCLPQPFDTPPAPPRPCCTCDGDCLDVSLDECDSLNGLWFADAVWEGGPLQCDTQFICPNWQVNPAHDECAEAEVIPVGVTEFSTACATTDGWNPVAVQSEMIDVDDDVWFEYHALQDCLMRIDMCENNLDLDSAIVVYTNGTSTCDCPLASTEHLAQLVAASDRGCAIPESQHGFVELPAGEGQCFLIRVGNRTGEGGSLHLDISCGGAFCGDDRTQAELGEECDGDDDWACPGSCNPPGHPQECQCGDICSCGNEIRCGAEECDGTDSDNCPGLCIQAGQPGQCTCQHICGNGVREGVEECDGPSDTSCGGEPGRCIAPGQPGECTCPPRVCGNHFQDPGEECDGTDDSICPGECRGPGDPAGECSCKCGICICLPDPPQPELPLVGKPRFLSFWLDPLWAGVDHGLRVELSSLHHPMNPPPGTPDFSAHEGDFRYVNSFSGTTICVDSATFNTDYRCAQLGCQPEYRDWASDLAGEVLHVTGEAVVTSSMYNAAVIGPSCGMSPQADTCAFATTSLTVSTSRWGDVGSGGGGNPDGAANVIDIGLVVDNVKGISTALPERRAWMKNPPNPQAHPVNVIDIGLTVDAVKGLPYPYPFPTCP